MAIGNLSGATFISWLTTDAAVNGLTCYTTLVENEIISAVDWYNKVYTDGHVKRINQSLKTNSITIQALSDDLKIFPLQRLSRMEKGFGIYIEAGTSHKLEGIGFEGFMVFGAAGQDIRFYMDLY